MTPKQAQNLKQFLSRQLRMQFMKLHTKKIDVFLPNIKIMKNLTYLDIIVYKMSLPTKFENASVTILKIAFSEIENWTFAAAFKFVQSFSKVRDLNVQIVLQDQMKLESPAEPITLETMKCLKEVALAFKCFKNNHEGKKMMKDIMQLIKIKQLQIFKIGPIDRVSNSESRITDSDWRAFCKKNPAIIHLVIRCYKPFYIKDDESLLRKYLRNLKCLQTSLNVSVCIGCPLLCVCQHRSEKYAANFLEHYQY